MKEIKLDDVIWKKGTKLLCIVDSDNERVQKGRVYETSQTFFMRNGLVNLRGGISYNPKFFVKCEDLTLEEAIKATMDGHKVQMSTWKCDEYICWDAATRRFIDETGYLINISLVSNRQLYSIVTKKNTTITLANGKKVELSEESYKALEDNA